jgi:hypothetical protein
VGAADATNLRGPFAQHAPLPFVVHLVGDAAAGKAHELRERGKGMAGASGKAARWREVIGPLFRDIWPLSANLRSKNTTQNLVHMVLECDQAFPEAVEAVLDFLVPYELYQIAHSLRLESSHDHLVSEHPLAYVRLANALFDPVTAAVPSDLAALLQECAAADPTVSNDPAYVRLYGFRRQMNA